MSKNIGATTDELKEMRVYCKLKKEPLDRALWRIRYGRISGPVVTQTTE